MVTLRTGVVILQRERVQDIKKFYVEASSLGVSVPGELKARLDALQKNAAGGAAA